MPKLHIELSENLHAQLVERAKKNKRFLKDEVIDILEHGINTALIPVIGTVDKNGEITLTNYWNSPEGIEQSR